MVLTGAAVLVNVVFNSIFVFCFNMGFRGIAYGTLISEIFCFLLSVLWLSKHQFIKGECGLSYKKLVKYITELLKLGIAQTIIAYFDGHQEDSKKKKALILTICYTVLYGLTGTVFIFTYSKTILSFFVGSGAIFQLGNSILRIVFSTFPLMGIFYTIITLYECSCAIK